VDFAHDRPGVQVMSGISQPLPLANDGVSMGRADGSAPRALPVENDVEEAARSEADPGQRLGPRPAGTRTTRLARGIRRPTHGTPP